MSKDTPAETDETAEGKAPGASGDAPVASTRDIDDGDEEIQVLRVAPAMTQHMLERIEETLANDRGRQTLTGALLIANAIIYAGTIIARQLAKRQ